MRIGHGYDVHRLVENRSLILGGVEIPHPRGLLGHSDADVLSHAVSDALLGAVALGDIGQHFPDSDEQYKGASSLALLKFVVDLLVKKGYAPYCLDSTLQCQDPKLAPFIPKMRTRLAEALGLPVERVSVKATTTEGLGFVGRKEGIAAHAVVLVNEID
ncbi:2-C-methyl-D-erythritol 2,4-cyclodiphosphate synthase [candidate division KSB1 bacterium]|nr:2-C-methyl-D-erythritol 2,4-cyclodiphosphate synthase [candidate division KSB1 bacterium]